MTGTESEIADAINEPFLNIWRYNGTLLKHRYAFEFIGYRQEKTEPVKPKLSKKEERLNEVYHLLKNTGITLLADREDPDLFIKKMAEKGLNVKTRKGKTLDGRGKVSYFDILEVA